MKKHSNGRFVKIWAYAIERYEYVANTKNDEISREDKNAFRRTNAVFLISDGRNEVIMAFEYSLISAETVSVQSDFPCTSSLCPVPHTS